MELGAKQSKGEPKVINVEEIKKQSNLDIDNNENLPQISPPSSPLLALSDSSSSSTSPRKMKSLADIYARCNFCVFEPKNFD